MRKKIKLATGMLIVTTALLFNLNQRRFDSVSILKFDEIDALACGENGCTKDYSKVLVEEYLTGAVVVDCSGCGSIKCKAPK